MSRSRSAFNFGYHRPGSLLFLRFQSQTTIPVEAECLTVFMGSYLRQLRAWGFGKAGEIAKGSYRRYSSDLVALGKGEVLRFTR